MRLELEWKFVQPNTFLKEDGEELRGYTGSNYGIIRSFAERAILGSRKRRYNCYSSEAELLRI